MAQVETKRLIQLYGAGGHGLVVASAALSAGQEIASVFDDDAIKWGNRLAGVAIESYSLNKYPSVPLVITLGDNILREKVAASVGHAFTSVVHASAVVAASVEIGEGSQVLAGVVINPLARIGRHTILNTGCIVEHHVEVGSFVHVTPGAILCGACKIGDGTTVGPGAVVVKGKQVGRGCVLAAGTVVVSDVPDHSRVQGVPGRITPLTEASWDWS